MSRQGQEIFGAADQLIVKRVFYFFGGVAVLIPICCLLTSFVQWQMEAMGEATPDTRSVVLWTLLTASIVILALVCRKAGPIQKKKRCRSVSNVSLHFRP